MKKILIVDDEPMLLKIVQRPLKDKYETFVAQSGAEGFQIFEKENPDLIISDVKMPEMSGTELFEKICAIRKDIPFIFMSADDDGCDSNLANLGNTGYIIKPIKADALIEMISELLEGSGNIKDAGETQKTDDEKEEDKLPGWLLAEPLIDIKEGLRNSDNAEVYMSSVKIFLEHVPGNVSEFERCLKDGDYETYTIKAHALKSTSRILGAMVLSTLAAAVERAGKQGNTDFLVSEHDEFIRLYRRYEKLFSQHVEVVSKESISEDVLKDMLMAIKEYAMAEDYTLMEMVVAALQKYQLPPDVDVMVADVKKNLLKLNWEQINDIINT